ncbi:NAD(P)H dehydrogenase (quinone) [Salinisphaera sp. PC39]|uniref:NAD(P)H-dependent oxidoreductase n=1 Tax=Salinisphaera sp. PC39 TaxID=1304156 RepID=UPI0033407C3D
MGKRILIIQGHPDPAGGHFCHAAAAAYADAARAAGHRVDLIETAGLDAPLIRNKTDWADEIPPPAIADCQRRIAAAEHLVILYPLWLGTMPARLKGFLEQVLRPGFAIRPEGDNGRWRKLLTGRSARIVVTMGMPAPVYRWYFRAHSLKSLERNILAFVGIAPVRETLFGLVELNAGRRERFLRRMAKLGARAR